VHAFGYCSVPGIISRVFSEWGRIMLFHARASAFCVQYLFWSLVLAGGIAGMVSEAGAVEGTTSAGPIGGNDIRSAVLPPPGLYGGIVGLASTVGELDDGKGQPEPNLNAVNLTAKIGGPFVAYVPNVGIFGGSVGVVGFFPICEECGQLVSSIPDRCVSGAADPYVEVAWSRSFGALRPSRDPSAFPILEGLAVEFSLGAVVPVGLYNAQTQVMNGVTLGNNTWDIAPAVAVTYTTPPLLAEGTEFSVKTYWDNFLTNPLTQYHAGTMIDTDFAVTEHIGRFQIGPAGSYAFQVDDDEQYDAIVPPDGRRLNLLVLGCVLNYDMPEYSAAVKIKALDTVFVENGPVSKTIIVTLAKKFF